MTEIENKKAIALTFDDGPSPYTDRLLDIFAQHGGKGTFLVMGERIEERASTLKRTADEGHEIGNHTFSHGPLNYMTDEEIIRELTVTNDMIKSITSKAPRLVRPPYGAFDDRVSERVCELSLSVLCWSLDTADWATDDPNAVIGALAGKVEDGDIILFHDSQKSTVDAMEILVPQLIEDGYELLTVPQLLELKGIPLKAGQAYYNAKK